MAEQGSGVEIDEALVRDYEHVAALNVKLTGDLLQEEGARAALERLITGELAVEQHGTIALMHPDDCSVLLDESCYARMLVSYREWLRADAGPLSAGASRRREMRSEGGTSADELLYGELGFWRHWWNRIRERDFEADGPLPMDIVVADDGSFEARSWLSEFDPQVRAYVLDGGLLRGRAIVPPRVLKSVVEPMLDLSAESGFEVRVLSTEARFVVYDGRVAVLNEPPGEHRERTDEPPEPYWAIRNPAVVDPLRHFFALLWRSATPFRIYRGEHETILELLARGCTDARIAQVLNLSTRTVSRRVSEIMSEHGAGSRFELGMMHGRSQRTP